MTNRNTHSQTASQEIGKTLDPNQLQAIRATAAIGLKVGHRSLGLSESDVLLRQDDGITEVVEEDEFDDEPLEPDDSLDEEAPDTELVEYLDDEDQFDNTQGTGGLTRFLSFKEEPRWWKLDSFDGPHVFSIERQPAGGAMQCLHRPKHWMINRRDMSVLQQGKQTMRQTLDGLAKAMQDKMPAFLASPSAANFAIDWANAIGFSAHATDLAEAVPWNAVQFVKFIWTQSGEESVLSRLRSNLLLVWPKWTLPFESLFEGGFKLEVAQALLHEYAQRAHWALPTGPEYAQTLAKYRREFLVLPPKERSRYSQGVMDSYSLRVVWEHKEKMSFQDPLPGPDTD